MRPDWLASTSQDKTNAYSCNLMILQSIRIGLTNWQEREEDEEVLVNLNRPDRDSRKSRMDGTT